MRIDGSAISRHPYAPDAADTVGLPKYEKIGNVIAFPAIEAGEITTPEGVMSFHAGDYIVTDDPITHAWPVQKAVFERTYQPAGQLLDNVPASSLIFPHAGSEHILPEIGSEGTIRYADGCRVETTKDGGWLFTPKPDAR